MKKADQFKGLQDAVLRMHGCASSHLGFARVKEVFRGRNVWEVVVVVFDFAGHPKTRFFYAWAHDSGPDGGKPRFVALLGIPPGTSPRATVLAAVLRPVLTEGQTSASTRCQKRRSPGEQFPCPPAAAACMHAPIRPRQEEECVRRAKPVHLLGLELRLATPEDLVIMKVIARRPRDIADIESIVEAHPRLDLRRVRLWISEFAAALETPELRSEFEALLARCRRRRT